MGLRLGLENFALPPGPNSSVTLEMRSARVKPGVDWLYSRLEEAWEPVSVEVLLQLSACARAGAQVRLGEPESGLAPVVAGLVSPDPMGQGETRDTGDTGQRGGTGTAGPGLGSGGGAWPRGSRLRASCRSRR